MRRKSAAFIAAMVLLAVGTVSGCGNAGDKTESAAGSNAAQIEAEAMQTETEAVKTETEALQAETEALQTDTEIQEEAAADTAAESGRYFIKGADISSLEAEEDNGAKFYDLDGQEVDVIRYLMENGCNYFRLRLWNHPTKSFDAGDYCNPEHTIEMAKRIKAAGGKYLLDFHYSDWWADPENQAVPAAWKGLSDDQLIRAVYDFTSETLTALGEADAYPDMVQIGNEIGNGMLWDYGSLKRPDMLAALINSGISAVRDSTPDGQKTQIMIHIQDGGSVGAAEEFFSMLEENKTTDYDIVGLSYYPYWHGTFADLKANVENIYSRFGKQVIVAETAYPYTMKNGDEKDNMVKDADAKLVGFEANVENQKLVLQLIMNTVAECEGGLGIFYWEPAWIPTDGVGVAAGDGNEWDNQTLFGADGRALESVSLFSFEPGTLDNDQMLLIYPFDNMTVGKELTGADAAAELPKTAKVLYMDGSIREEPVTWDPDSRKQITETRVSYKGTVLGQTVSMGADLADSSVLVNLDFEDGEIGWKETDSKSAGKICNDKDSYPHSGDWSYQFWCADAFDIDLCQTVKVNESGEYHLQVWSQGIEESDLRMTLYIADQTGSDLASYVFTNDGWNVWQHPLATASLEEGDTVRIGVRIQGNADDWGTLDEFTFYTGEPQECIDTVGVN